MCQIELPPVYGLYKCHRFARDVVDTVRVVRPIPSSTELLLKVEVGKVSDI